MATITRKGYEIHTIGELPKIGLQAPLFSLAAEDLKDIGLEAFQGKKKILNIFPSLDTPICAASVHTFYKMASRMENVIVLNISMDLPFAQSRFCNTENLNVVTLSGFRSNFGNDYGVVIIDGPLKGLYSRAVVVLDEKNTVIYTQQVNEVSQEPNYESALHAVS